jgi:hypothetical protein
MTHKATVQHEANYSQIMTEKREAKKALWQMKPKTAQRAAALLPSPKSLVRLPSPAWK